MNPQLGLWTRNDVHKWFATFASKVKFKYILFLNFLGLLPTNMTKPNTFRIRSFSERLNTYISLFALLTSSFLFLSCGRDSLFLLPYGMLINPLILLKTMVLVCIEQMLLGYLTIIQMKNNFGLTFHYKHEEQKKERKNYQNGSLLY